MSILVAIGGTVSRSRTKVVSSCAEWKDVMVCTRTNVLDGGTLFEEVRLMIWDGISYSYQSWTNLVFNEENSNAQVSRLNSIL